MTNTQDMEPNETQIGHEGRCNSLKRQPEYEGERCKKRAGWGTIHLGVGACRTHGGSTRNHVRFAELVEAKEYVKLFGGRKDIHPAQALLELVQAKASEVEYWRYRVSLLADEDLTYGITKVKSGGNDFGTTEEAKPNAALQSMWACEKQLADYSAAAIKSNVSLEMVEVAKAQASQLTLVLRTLVADPRVSIDGQPDAVIVDALRVLERPQTGVTA